MLARGCQINLRMSGLVTDSRADIPSLGLGSEYLRNSILVGQAFCTLDARFNLIIVFKVRKHKPRSAVFLEDPQLKDADRIAAALGLERIGWVQFLLKPILWIYSIRWSPTLL